MDKKKKQRENKRQWATERKTDLASLPILDHIIRSLLLDKCKKDGKIVNYGQ